MSINFGCPECGKTFSVKEQYAGRKAKCPCGNKFNIPTETEEPDAKQKEILSENRTQLRIFGTFEFIVIVMIIVAFFLELAFAGVARAIITFFLSPTILVIYAVDRQSLWRAILVGLLVQLIPVTGYMLSGEVWYPKDTHVTILICSISSCAGALCVLIARRRMRNVTSNMKIRFSLRVIVSGLVAIFIALYSAHARGSYYIPDVGTLIVFFLGWVMFFSWDKKERDQEAQTSSRCH